ncbi:MAG: aspartate aminotransferase family protein [Candidatus Heimdallarchaeota archaeon]
MTSFILQTNEFESIIIEKAQGTWIWDVDGKAYLDGESGMWCCNLGHNHPKMIQALKNQAELIIHRNKNFLTPITLESAKKLLDFVPNDFDRVTFLNSGSEAMEFAINFAKKATGRTKVLTLLDSYIGAFGSAKDLSFTSTKDLELKVPYPKCNTGECEHLEKYTSVVDREFEKHSADLACFVLEPVMVSGGVFKSCSKLIKYICEKIQDIGGLIVIDEVTTGFGRTGFKFGYELFNIIPDIVVLGKALGNGYPVSAVITNSELESKISKSELYYAQSHQLDPLGAAVVSSVIDIFNGEQILENAKEKIIELRSFVKALSYPFIKETRSFGMIFAIQIQSYRNISSKDLILQIKDALIEEGVIIGFNLAREFIRILPPLNISDKEISYFKEKIVSVLDSIKEIVLQ